MTPIKSIDKELADCRQAWADHPAATLAWCCHHRIHLEPLTELAANRIAYILNDKPQSERAVRLRNFRPVRVKLPSALAKANADRAKARADWAKAYADLAKANADWAKANADWAKANADRAKARADWAKAYADLAKARADLDKAYADWDKAYAEHLDQLASLHAQDWPDHTWKGKSIFG